MTTRPACLHPHLVPQGEGAECTRCGQPFGMCERHGVFDKSLHVGCPKCASVKVEAAR